MPRNSTQWKLAGPRTLRRSSVKILGKWGGNIQNIEESIREIYITDGYRDELRAKCSYWLQTGDLSVFTEEELSKLRVFVKYDQSGAEALIIAYDCENKDYRQLFIHNVKPHVYVAMKLFKDVWRRKMKLTGGLIEDFNIDEIANTPIKDLKLNPFWRDLDLLIKSSDDWSLQERYYYLAKQTVHSANYGIEWATFQMNILEKSGGKIVVPDEDAKMFLLVYRSLFPEIPERNRRIEQQARDTGILYNMLGFPYQITDWSGSHMFDRQLKELYAWGPQSTVGEITRIAFSEMQYWVEEHNKPWDVLIDNHDMYMSQCPLMDVKECSEKMKEFINQRLVSPVDGTVFNMKSECQIGFNWHHKNDKNPVGLQEMKW